MNSQDTKALESLEDLKKRGILNEKEYLFKKQEIMKKYPKDSLPTLSTQDSNTLKTLEDLKNKKVLTEQEFDVKKQELLKKYQIQPETKKPESDLPKIVSPKGPSSNSQPKVAPITEKIVETSSEISEADKTALNKYDDFIKKKN